MTYIIEKDDIVPYYRLRKSGDDEGRRNGMKSPRAQVGTVVLRAVLAAGLLIALSQLSALRERAGTGRPVPAPAAGGTASQSGATAQPALAGLRQPTLGDPEAPVLIVEFAEFYCPYCAKFTWETFPKIEEDYIATGRVRYEFRNLVVHGEAALLAAVAGECAHDGGRFWSYLDRLFLEIFPGRNLYRRRELGVNDLVRLALQPPGVELLPLQGEDVRHHAPQGTQDPQDEGAPKQAAQKRPAVAPRLPFDPVCVRHRAHPPSPPVPTGSQGAVRPG